MSFLYPMLNFLQPGILWPALADYRPMLVFSCLALVVGFFSRPEYPRVRAFSHPIFICLLAFIFAQVLSLYYGGVGSMLSEFSFWSSYLIFVFVSVLLITNVAMLRRYILGMIAGGMFIVAYGILSVLNGWDAAMGGRAGAYGMYENHNDYTFAIIQILPFIYMYFQVAKGLLGRSLLVLAMLACVVGVFSSLSRGGMIGLVLEAFLIVLFAVKGKQRMILLPVLALTGALAVSYQYAMRAENQGSHYTAEQAESSRFELWRAARKMFESKPILGVGSRRFGEFSQEYAEISYDNRGKNSHNTYLEILTGSGLAGLVAFFLMSFYLIRELRRRNAAVGSPWLYATQTAALISFYSILFRALVDAKQSDWSFYSLFTIGIVCGVLRRQSEEMSAGSMSDQKFQETSAGKAVDSLAHLNGGNVINALK